MLRNIEKNGKAYTHKMGIKNLHLLDELDTNQGVILFIHYDTYYNYYYFYGIIFLEITEDLNIFIMSSIMCFITKFNYNVVDFTADSTYIKLLITFSSGSVHVMILFIDIIKRNSIK